MDNNGTNVTIENNEKFTTTKTTVYCFSLVQQKLKISFLYKLNVTQPKSNKN